MIDDLFKRHVIGELVDKVQRCIICGEVINDYRNALTLGNELIKGFEVGEVFIRKGNPTILTKQLQEEEDYRDCTD